MTRRSLELTRTLREGEREGSLLQAIDRTCTPMGARLLAEWLTSPLTDRPAPIAERHDAVAELHRPTRQLRADLRDALGEANDLERLAARVGTGRASPRDLVALARTLAAPAPDQGPAHRAAGEAAGRPRRPRWSSAPRSARRSRRRSWTTRRWPSRKGA